MFKINFHSLCFSALLFLNNPNVRLCSSIGLNNNTTQSQQSLFPNILPQVGNNDSTAPLLPIESSITPQPYNWYFNSSTNTFILPFTLAGWGHNMSTDTFNINNFSLPITHESGNFNDTSARANNNHSLLIPDASISGNITPSVAPYKQQQSATSTNQDKDHALSENKKKIKIYICSMCNKNVKGKSSFKYHLRTHNPNRERLYQCNLCFKSFAEKHILKNHIERHSNEKPFKCDFCRKRFKTKSEKTIHHRTHTKEKPYQCSTCDKCFALKATLRYHIRTHTGEKRFKCEICGKGLSTKKTLENHLNLHRGRKPYSCEECQKSFRKKRRLNEHCKLHKNPKPYKCDLCTKAYASKYRYNEHMKMHDSFQLYTCNYCRASFLYKSKYDNHILYEEEKDEDRKCHICKKVYSDKYHLRRHNKKFHPET